MKICVMTHWWSSGNYGQILQAYALQRYLSELGHDVRIIKYEALLDVTFDYSTVKTIVKSLRRWVKVRRRFIVESYFQKEDNRAFRSFKRRRLRFSQHFRSYQRLQKRYPSADLYITGSDQVWGPWTKLEPYLLAFCTKDERRIAYAASFGREKLSSDETALFKRYLSEMDTIGVREHSGVELCKTLGREDAQFVPDPTLLLSSSRWDELRNGVESPYNQRTARNYFIYKVGKDGVDEFQKIMTSLETLHPDSERVCCSDSESTLANSKPTIEEWLFLIAESDIVFTNSFHGLVFSLIYRKTFFIIPRKGEKAEQMNTRFHSLLSQFGLTSQILEQIDHATLARKLNHAIEWENVNVEIDRLRERGKTFLNEILAP